LLRAFDFRELPFASSCWLFFDEKRVCEELCEPVLRLLALHALFDELDLVPRDVFEVSCFAARDRRSL
jgi:hypothetical protein